MIRLTPVALAAALAATAALAQMPPGTVRVAGTVTAVTADKLTVTGADGKTIETRLSPAWYAVAATPMDMDAIKPGSFIATANLQMPTGEGQAIELRMFEPGSKLGEGNRPMAQPNTMMTNATVSKITKGARGREIDVAYPGGTRHIVVPPDVQLIASMPADRSAVKPGAMVTTLAAPAADGVPEASRVTVNPPKP